MRKGSRCSAGISIVSSTMRQRGENALATYDEEKPKVQEASKGAKDRIAQRAQQRAEQVKPNGDTAGAHRLPAPGR